MFFKSVTESFLIIFYEKYLGEFYEHILRIMLAENSVKLANNFYCEKCDYKTCRKNDFNKHLQSKKHNAQNGSKMLMENSLYICNCNKKYKHIQSFNRHKKKCKGEKKEENTIIESDNKDTMKDLVFKLINENQELRKTITEMIPKIGNNNNNLKQKFNINVFLNEKCKDALSMDEFIDKIEISMKNLLTTKEKGNCFS